MKTIDYDVLKYSGLKVFIKYVLAMRKKYTWACLDFQIDGLLSGVILSSVFILTVYSSIHWVAYMAG